MKEFSHPYKHVFSLQNTIWMKWLFSVFVNKAINAQSVKINHKKSHFFRIYFCGQKIRQIDMRFVNNQFSQFFWLFFGAKIVIGLNFRVK